jgi:hypothetical protein
MSESEALWNASQDLRDYASEMRARARSNIERAKRLCQSAKLIRERIAPTPRLAATKERLVESRAFPFTGVLVPPAT